MKNLKDSVLENAHLYLMAITLVVAVVGWSVSLPHATIDSSFAWFGYVPMSI